MTKISILQNKLTVEMLGWDKLWALKSRLEIPLAHVSGIRSGAGERPCGLRLPGTYIPRLITAGTYVKAGRRVFWAVHDPRQTVAIDLHDEFYSSLVVQVADLAATVALLQNALAPVAA